MPEADITTTAAAETAAATDTSIGDAVEATSTSAAKAEVTEKETEAAAEGVKAGTNAALGSKSSSKKGKDASSLLLGTDIAKVLASSGPVVKCVLLRHMRMDGKDGKPHAVPKEHGSPVAGKKRKSSDADDDSAALGSKKNETADEKQSGEHQTITKSAAVSASSASDHDEASGKSSSSGLDLTTHHRQHHNHLNHSHLRVVLTDLIQEVEVDTTPSKNSVRKLLGGPFTFLGQYPDEGTVVMARRELVLPEMDQEDEDDDEEENGAATSAKAGGDQVLDTKTLSKYSVKQLKELCREHYGDEGSDGPHIDLKSMVEKNDLVQALLQAQLPVNPHQLQPPLDRFVVRGDILIMRVAETKEELDEDDEEEEEDDNEAEGDEEKVDNGEDAAPVGEEVKAEKQNESSSANEEGDVKDETKKEDETKADAESGTPNGDDESDDEGIQVPSNDEFFLDYTKDEYIEFASRTDIVAPESPPQDEDEEEEEDQDDDQEEEEAYVLGEEEEEEEEKKAMLNLLMGEVLRQFREENGRGPNSVELLELRSQVADKLGVQVPSAEEILATRESNKREHSNEGENGHHHHNKRVKFSPEVILNEIESNNAENDAQFMMENEEGEEVEQRNNGTGGEGEAGEENEAQKLPASSEGTSGG